LELITLVTKPSFAVALVAVLLLFGSLNSLQAQQCQAPPLNVAAQGRNIFNDQQEMDLGDAVYEQVTRDFRVIDDPVLTQRLQSLVDRLVQKMPPTSLRFRVGLLELQDANALTMPGGRIFVSRKMAAFVKDEDELAGVLAHELGHGFARHSAIDFTFLFKEVLGVTEVTDRADIFEKFKRLIEMGPRKPGPFEKIGRDVEDDQGQADLIGLYAMAQAGYDPESQAAFWERYTGLRREQKGGVTKVLGASAPNKKRLLEMLKVVATLPASCKGVRTGASTEFRQWQLDVVNHSPSARKENLPGLVFSKKLDRPLKNQLKRVRFSPDGKFVLAQDDAGIAVIDHERLAVMFHIDAPDAVSPAFSPDSTDVVFRTANLRVERWDVAAGKLRTAHEVFIRTGCIQSELSPDGKTLACFDWKFDLNLVDVASGSVFFTKKELQDKYDVFANRQLGQAMEAQDDTSAPFETELIQMRFSPDGRYFLAGARSLFSVKVENTVSFGPVPIVRSTNDMNTIGFDLMSRTKMSLGGEIKEVISRPFGFVGNDKIFGLRQFLRTGDSPNFRLNLISFPKGEIVEKFDLPSFWFETVTCGDAILLPTNALDSKCTLDLKSKVVSKLPGQRCLDAFEGIVASQAPNGDLGFYDLKGGSPRMVKLPPRRQTKVIAVDFTPESDWLAVSNSSDGGVWNLANGERVLYVPGFRSGYIDKDRIFHGDILPFATGQRAFNHYNLASREVVKGPTKEFWNVIHEGSVTLRMIWSENRKNLDRPRLVVTNATDATPLWTMEFPKVNPVLWASRRLDTLIMQWPATSEALKEDLKLDWVLRKRFDSLKAEDREEALYLRVVETRSGKVVGRVLLDTGRGTFRIREVFAAGNWLVATDDNNRVVVYALDTGEEKAALFGVESTLSPAGNLLAIQNATGTLDMYDLKTFQKRETYVFPTRIGMVQFNPDGKRLFVLTSDQTAYVLDTSGYIQP
jgi:WD40 repeat protein